MAFTLSEYDQELVKNVKIEIVAAPVGGGFNISSNIAIQFPPHITSDGKTANWKTQIGMGLWEPIVIGYNVSARKVSIKLKYVCTGQGKWKPRFISNTIKDIRAYFTSAMGKDVKSLLPFIKVKLYDHLPDDPTIMTFRGISVSEKPGGSYITVPGEDGEGPTTYALSTEVVLVLELVTKLTKGKDSDEVTSDARLLKAPPKRWY